MKPINIEISKWKDITADYLNNISTPQQLENREEN